MGGDSSVCIVTLCGLDVSGFELRWWQNFAYPSRPVLGPAGPLYLVILRGKVAGEWRSTSTPLHHHHSSVEIVNGWSYTSTPTLCLHGPLWGELYLFKLVLTTIQLLTLNLLAPTKTGARINP